MPRQIYVNLPVKDLTKSMEFFKKLGFEFNPRFTNEKGGCMIVSDTIFVMLLPEEFFKTFTKKDIADSTKTTEVINAISIESKEKVDEMVNKALSIGGKPSKDSYDEGFMYGWSFQDLDGHIWEVLTFTEQK
jgi:predicted lactoylglutathione lyase